MWQLLEPNVQWQGKKTYYNPDRQLSVSEDNVNDATSFTINLLIDDWLSDMRLCIEELNKDTYIDYLDKY
jgi:hypothetical protein